MHLHINSFAKFNIFLGILSRRPDKFHELDTVLQTINLGDELDFEPLSVNRLVVESDGDGVPSGSENLVWQALALIQKKCHVRSGMAVHLRKQIPAQAGLGGGSSNAASAICAANSLWNLGLDPTQLEEIAALIGSDVPFFIRGGTQRCQGRGEILTKLPPLPDSQWIVVKPPESLSTKRVFNRVRSILTPRTAAISISLEFLAKRDLLKVVKHGFNDLEKPAMELQPQMTGVRQWMLERGLIGIRLAGSGSAWIGYCPDEGSTSKTLEEDGRKLGWAVYRVRPVGRGWTEA